MPGLTLLEVLCVVDLFNWHVSQFLLLHHFPSSSSSLFPSTLPPPSPLLLLLLLLPLPLASPFCLSFRPYPFTSFYSFSSSSSCPPPPPAPPFPSSSPSSSSFPARVCFSFCRSWCWSVGRVQQSDRQETPIYCSPSFAHHTFQCRLKLEIQIQITNYKLHITQTQIQIHMAGKRLLYIAAPPLHTTLFNTD